MQIWKFIKKSPITLAIFILLFYTREISINNFLNTQNKISPENINQKYMQLFTQASINTEIQAQENSSLLENIKTYASTEIIIQKNAKVSESLIQNNFSPESLVKEKNSPETIIDSTKNLITTELKQSTKDLVKMLDETIASGGGKLRIFKGLKCQHESKKKINETATQLEKLINETVVKLETKNAKKNLLIKEKTGKFIEKTKKSVFDMHKNMSCEMRNSIGKCPEIVKNNTCAAKKQITEFENKIVTKIAKFSDKLKADIKREII